MHVFISYFVNLFTPRATSIMYMRRCGIPFETITKVMGHQNLESLTKHYGLQLEVHGGFLV